MKNKETKKILLIISAFVLCTIGVILAYYSSVKDIDNAMQTSTSEMVLNEIFNENDNWVAGETKQKEVSFENTGEIEQLLRFTITEVWYDSEGNVWNGAEDDAVTANYTQALTDEWTLIDGYYYYNTTISPGEETNIVMESVSFSSSLDNGGYGSSVDYSDKKCSLTVEMEAIEVNADVAKSSWNVSCSIDTGTNTIIWGSSN